MRAAASTVLAVVSTPGNGCVNAPCRASAAAKRALEGTQPTFTQVPPVSACSIITTEAPRRVASIAQAKPALPFSGGDRIVDFVLSNLLNSGISRVYVLAQYKPRSLIAHLSATWALPSLDDRRSPEVVLPGSPGSVAGYRGTADAVYQNLHLVDRHAPELVAVFAADHVYRMDIGQMADFHLQRRADVTVAAVPVPLARARAFGVIGADAEGRVHEFQEKPERPRAIPSRPDYAFASMGNYLFRPEALVAALRRANQLGEHDFGWHVLPRLARTHRTYAYDFASNAVPGLQAYEERGYWRDVGTLEAYRAALADARGPQPRFQLRNPQWPIRGRSADRGARSAQIR